MVKQVVARNFSRCARSYDLFSDIQMRAAQDLTDRITQNEIESILELGCGTGNYTLLLRDKFKDARLTALDISEEMIEVAWEKLKGRQVELLQADAEELNLEEKFGLVTSNACFQWFANLEKGLLNYKKMLNPDGKLIFSIFGPKTLFELNDSFSAVLDGFSIDARKFPERNKLEQFLKDNFKSVKVSEIVYVEIFPDLKFLLKKLKYSGTRGSGLAGQAYLSKSFLQKAEAAYMDKYKEIRTTYQVFFCEAGL
ncbi:MAG: methyltransferase domain-containing protein [Candidatus Omnitrophica bacterium]|nr:methyltransferase domain-containing protein [Candidatus Omnitrophota bacterium]